MKDGDLTSFVAALNSDNEDHVLQGAHRIRKMLSAGNHPLCLND